MIIIDCQNDISKQSNYKQLTKDLPLFDDNGIIRCKGWLENPPLPYDSKYSIFLPKCHLADLLVCHFHALALRNGVKETHNELRTKYWMLKARSFIQSYIYKCRLPYGQKKSRKEVTKFLAGD